MKDFIFLAYLSLHLVNESQTSFFPTSGFLVTSLLNKQCHNSRDHNDIDMKLMMLRIFYDYVMLVDCGAVVIFSNQQPIRSNLDSRCMIPGPFITTIYLTKLKKIYSTTLFLTQHSHIILFFS